MSGLCVLRSQAAASRVQPSGDSEGLQKRFEKTGLKW